MEHTKSIALDAERAFGVTRVDDGRSSYTETASESLQVALARGDGERIGQRRDVESDDGAGSELHFQIVKLFLGSLAGMVGCNKMF